MRSKFQGSAVQGTEIQGLTNSEVRMRNSEEKKGMIEYHNSSIVIHHSSFYGPLNL